MATPNRITRPIPPTSSPSVTAQWHIARARILVDVLADRDRLSYMTLETTLRVISNELQKAGDALRGPTTTRTANPPLISGDAFTGRSGR